MELAARCSSSPPFVDEPPLYGLDGRPRRPSRRYGNPIVIFRYLPDSEKLMNSNGVLISRYSTFNHEIESPRISLVLRPVNYKVLDMM